jgi:ubiquitin C-terminal hydrolase
MATSDALQGTGYGGLINMGNTCYANATIQALRHCAKIPWILEQGRYNSLFRGEPAEPRAKQQALSANFAEIVQLLGQCKRGQKVRPADFWAKFGGAVKDTGFEHLAAKIPHDSHEFYLFMLDTLHESMAQEVNMKILKPPPTTDAERHVIQALETWRTEFTKKYSPLVDLFYGLQHIVIRCKACGYCSHRWEVFSTLKAQVPKGAQAATLAEMLTAEFQPETIEGYACDKCAPTRTDAEKTISLWRLPLNLVVVLKRFTFDGRKIGTPCSALEGGTFDFGPYFSAESPERGGSTAYSLHSIVDHHGGMNGGHYTAQCKREEWLIYDDEGVMSGNGAPQMPFFGSSTYMLFLTRGTKAVPEKARAA